MDRKPIDDEIAQRIGEAIVGLLGPRQHRNGGFVTRQGPKDAVAIGYLVARLVEDARQVERPPPPPAQVSPRRKENGWMLLRIAHDRRGERWAIWECDEGIKEYQATEGDERTAKAPPSGAGGWRDLGRLMTMRGLSNGSE